MNISIGSFTIKYSYYYTRCMSDGVTIPGLPGYVSVKEAAEMLGVSDKRVYQYVMAGRLPARRIGHMLILPVEEVRRFRPQPSGRARTRSPSWRVYRSRGTLLVTDIAVAVRPGCQVRLLEKLRTIQQEDRHLFPGTVARYILKDEHEQTFQMLRILLVWKDTEMPDEATRQRDLAAFQEELADLLDWSQVQIHTYEALLHT
jgi:excisionase family DNA binding protein